MSNDKQDIHNLAAQYLDLWQKQLHTGASERMVEDSIKTMETFNEQAQEVMKSLDSPEKMQTWMTTWADAWKDKLSDGANPFEQFFAFQKGGTAAASAASDNATRNMDELTRRIGALEQRVAELEAQLKK